MPRSCPACGSRKWRKDAVTGNAICEEGHVYQDFRSENLVTEPGTNYALQKRRMKKAPRRNRRRELGTSNLEYYHGEEAEWLKMEAIQLALRYQVQALRKLWSLPDVYEMIVRDLWAYQLAIHPLPFVPEPSSRRDHSSPPDQEGENEDQPSGDKSDERDKSDNENDESGEDKSDQSDRDGDRSEGEDGIDPELLERVSDSSGESEGEKGDEEVNERDRRWKKKRRRLRMVDTLVTLVVGLWALRVPVMNVEIQGIVDGNQIPYIDFAHTTLLPGEMIKHMNRDVISALSPRNAPRPIYLFDQCRQFARTLSRHFGIAVPDVNAPPVIWRTISALGGSPTTYAQVTRLMALLDVNLSLQERAVEIRTRAPRARAGRSRGSSPMGEDERVIYERTTKYMDTALPELSAVAAWAILMKLAYGLDGETRRVLVRSDPAVGLPTGESWVGELRHRLATGALRGYRADLDAQDFGSKDLGDIDRYLDKCESILLKHREFPSDTSAFPLPPRSNIDPRVPTLGSWRTFHASLETIAPSRLSDEEPTDTIPLIPGDSLRSYDAKDLTGTLPPEYEVVLKAAAEVVGVAEEEVAQVVEILERRLEKVRKDRGETRGRSRRGSRSRSKSRTGRASSVGGVLRKRASVG